MASYYEAVIATNYEKNGETKSRFTSVGAGFPFKNKPGFKLVLDMPIVLVPGQAELLFMEPQPKKDKQQAAQESAPADVDF